MCKIEISDLTLTMTSMRSFECVPATYATEKIKNFKTILKLTFIKCHVHCLSVFKTSQASNQCHYMANIRYLIAINLISRNEFYFWKVHDIMNTSGLLQSK